MYSAFGVDHYGQEIAKKDSKLLLKARPLVQQGAARVASATRSVIGDPANANLSVRQAARPIGEKLAADSPYHGAISAVRGVRARVKGAAAHNVNATAHNAKRGNKNNQVPLQSTRLSDNVTLGDVHNAANVKRTVHAPENLLRGKKTTTTQTNLLTGENRSKVSREGNRFLKPLESETVNGTTTKIGDKTGGLTGQGKVAFVGGPVAAAGLGGAAYSEKKRNASTGY